MRRRRHMYIPRQESATPYIGLCLSIVLVILFILYFFKEAMK
jgi:hypothetical protein